MENLPTFSRGKLIFSSAAPEEPPSKHKPLDLIDLLSIAQHHLVDFLPITWHEALGPLGEGGSAHVSQSHVDLKASFAFKRFVRRENRREKALQYIAAEIRVLRSESLRSHPNIVNLLGVCWEFCAERKSIAPVLVFPKAPLGDIHTFLVGGDGRSIPFTTKLSLCVDVAMAMMTLHNTSKCLRRAGLCSSILTSIPYIIHGDIKPQNILVFRDDRENPLAKLIDFAYSCFGADINSRVYLPRTSPWILAPEWHPRGFSLAAAKRLDVFSYGMLCVWILFQQEISNLFGKSGENCVEDLLHDLKAQRQILHAVQVIIQDLDLEDEERRAQLGEFFSMTIADDPKSRECDFGRLIHYLNPQRHTSSSDNITAVPHAPVSATQPTLLKEYKFPTLHAHFSFSIPKSMIQLFWTDYRLRVTIAELLEKRTSNNTCPECADRYAYQLAILYHTGFGTARNEAHCHLWLAKSKMSSEYLNSSLTQISNGQVFRSSQFIDLWFGGSITLADVVQSYRDSQILSSAECHLRREAADLEACFGNDHFLTNTLKALLADILQAEDRLVEATRLYGEVLESRQRNTHPGHPSNVSTMLSLASVLEERGMWTDSERILRAALASVKSTLGAHHPTKILCLAHLGAVLGQMERWDEAEELDREALQESLDHFGREHPNSVKAMGNLAMSLDMRGKLEEAEILQSENLQLSRKLLGDTHPDTLTSLSNLAQGYGAQKRWEEARALQEQVLDLRKKVLEPNHSDVLSSSANLAATYIELQMLGEAEEILTELAAKGEEVFGAENPKQLAVKTNLVELYRRQGRLQEAWDLSVKVMELSEKVRGLKHSKTMQLIATQARILWEGGQVENARISYENVVSLSLEVYGAKNQFTMSNCHGLAICIHAQGDNEGAIAVMEEVLRLRREILGPDDPETCNSARALELWGASNKSSS